MTEFAAGTRLAEGIVLERRLGRGGHGEVWAAAHRAFAHPVAVKLLHDPDPGRISIARFQQEAQLLTRLASPHIVEVLEVGYTEDGRPYWVMELLAGEDLGARFKRPPNPLSTAQTLAIVTQTCEALARAHEMGVVHRDVKPANLFLAERPGGATHVKLLDFGVARRTHGAGLDMTRTGVIVGTPYYMSPEQLLDPRDVDHRTDLWSMAVVAYACLTGSLPFRQPNFAALSVAIHQGAFTPPSERRTELPTAVDGWMAQALHRDRALRFDTARALAAALERALFETAPETERMPATLQGPAADVWSAEERLECVLVIPSLSLASTLARTPTDAPSHLQDVVRACGGELEIAADGARLVRMPRTASADEAGLRAIHCAVALERSGHAMASAIVAGRGTTERSTAALASRGESLLASAGEGIWLDDTAAALLRERLDLDRAGDAWRYRRSRNITDERSVLLGAPTPFVGRHAELAQINASLAECTEESVARAVLVTGQAGVGKSRLRREFARQGFAGRRWFGRAHPGEADVPFALGASVLRNAAGIAEDDDADVAGVRFLRFASARGARREEIDALGALVVANPDESQRPRPPTRDQVVAAWLSLLDAECRAQPLVLSLDDLHWADRPSVDLVDLALQRLRDRPLFILASARPEVHERFAGLWRNRPRLELALGGVAPSGSAQLVRAVLGPGVTDEVIDDLVARSDGNPFLLEELIRATADPLTRHPPPSALALLEGRIARHDADVRRVLRAAAVLGTVIDPDAVAFLLAESPDDVERCLRELVASELVAGEGAAGDIARYRFRHELIRNAAYGMLPAEERRSAHHGAASWLSIHGADPSELAEHLHLAGDDAAAARHHRRAAEQLSRLGDFDNAMRHAELAMRRGGLEGADRAALLTTIAECHHGMGARAESLACAEEARRSSPLGSVTRAQAARIAARVSHIAERYELVDELEAEFSAWPAADGDSQAVEAAISFGVQIAVIQSSRFGAERGLSLLRRALAMAQPTEATTPFARGVRGQASSHLARFAGDWQGAAEWAMLSADAFERAGELRRRASMLDSLGFAYIRLGLYEQAVATQNLAVEVARSIVADNIQGGAKANLGLALLRLGRLDEAREALRDAHRFLGDARITAESYACAYLAEVEATASPLRALPTADRAVREGESREAALAHHLGVRAAIHLRSGQLADADADSARALAILERLGSLEEGDEQVRLVRIEVLGHLGRHDHAIALLRRARHSILEQAQRVQNPTWRQAFLERVPENARTLALAAERGLADPIDLDPSPESAAPSTATAPVAPPRDR